MSIVIWKHLLNDFSSTCRGDIFWVLCIVF